MFFFYPPLVYAQSGEEKKFLLMYFKEDELEVISATRSLKSITRVAENVTVITAEDIELMNAHTAGRCSEYNNRRADRFQGRVRQCDLTFYSGVIFKHVVVFIDGYLDYHHF